MHGLKINLDAIVQDPVVDVQQGLCSDGIHLGSLHISSEGLTASGEVGPSYVLSLQDLHIVPDEEGGFLGQGSSGCVRRAIHRRTGMKMALKEIKCTDSVHLNEIRRELETLHTREDELCPYLVKLFGAFCHEGSVFIAMECLDGSLDRLRQPIPCPVLACIIRRILHGLAYLHRTRHLLHRDLKPSNVLFRRRTGDVKLSDFGITSSLEYTAGCAQSFVGTVTYMSPERLHAGTYSYAADIWSLGLLVSELATGEIPFARLRDGSTEARFWALVQHLRGTDPVLDLPTDMDVDLRNFILSCLHKTPEQRPRCDELLEHPFILKYLGASEVTPHVHGAAGLSTQRRNTHVTTSTTTTVSSRHGICVHHVMDEGDKKVIRRWFGREERARQAGHDARLPPSHTPHDNHHHRHRHRTHHHRHEENDNNHIRARSSSKEDVCVLHRRPHRHRGHPRESASTDSSTSHTSRAPLPSAQTASLSTASETPNGARKAVRSEETCLSESCSPRCEQATGRWVSGEAARGNDPVLQAHHTGPCHSEAFCEAQPLNSCAGDASKEDCARGVRDGSCGNGHDEVATAEAESKVASAGTSPPHVTCTQAVAKRTACGEDTNGKQEAVTAEPTNEDRMSAARLQHHCHRRHHEHRHVHEERAQAPHSRHERDARHNHHHHSSSHRRSRRHGRPSDSSRSYTSLDLDAEIDRLLLF